MVTATSTQHKMLYTVAGGSAAGCAVSPIVAQASCRDDDQAYQPMQHSQLPSPEIELDMQPSWLQAKSVRQLSCLSLCCVNLQGADESRCSGCIKLVCGRAGRVNLARGGGALMHHEVWPRAGAARCVRRSSPWVRSAWPRDLGSAESGEPAGEGFGGSTRRPNTRRQLGPFLRGCSPVSPQG